VELLMNPLMFVNWQAVADAFRGLAWLAVVVLACYVLALAITPRTAVPPHHLHPRAVLVGH
jgi:hypothetical protein